MTFKNKQKFLKDFKMRLVDNPDAKTEKVMERVTRKVMNDAKVSVSKKGRGRSYPRKSGPPHTANSIKPPDICLFLFQLFSIIIQLVES